MRRSRQYGVSHTTVCTLAAVLFVILAGDALGTTVRAAIDYFDDEQAASRPRSQNPPLLNSCRLMQQDAARKLIVVLNNDSNVLTVFQYENRTNVTSYALKSTLAQAKLYLNLENDLLFIGGVEAQDPNNNRTVIIAMPWPHIEKPSTHTSYYIEDLWPTSDFIEWDAKGAMFFFSALNATQRGLKDTEKDYWWVIAGKHKTDVTYRANTACIGYLNDEQDSGTSAQTTKYQASDRYMRLLKEKQLITCVGPLRGVMLVNVSNFQVVYSNWQISPQFDFQGNVAAMPPANFILVRYMLFLDLQTGQEICRMKIVSDDGEQWSPLATAYVGNNFFLLRQKPRHRKPIDKNSIQISLAEYDAQDFEVPDCNQTIYPKHTTDSSPYTSQDTGDLVPIGQVSNGEYINFLFPQIYYAYHPGIPLGLHVYNPENCSNILDFFPVDDGYGALACRQEGLFHLPFERPQNNPIENDKTKFYVYILIAVGVVLVVTVIVFVVTYLNRKKKIEELQKRLMESNNLQSPGSRVLDHSYFQQRISEWRRENTDSQCKELTKQQFFEKYEKQTQIGKGGFASVFQYRDRQSGEEVAVKVSACIDQEDFDDKTDEVKLIEQLQVYPNVVQLKYYVLHFEEDETSQIYLVMEKARCTLQDLIVQNRKSKVFFQENFLLKLAFDMVDTLSVLQERDQIAHRDIKPSNILIFDGQREQFKLSDFGCSKRYSLSDYTKTRTLTGSPVFLSPQIVKHYERQNNKLTPNRRANVDWDFFKSDVFSLGLSILSAATLQGVMGLNQNKRLLEDRLTWLQKNTSYNNLLIYLIRKMLVWEEYRRPSFSMLKAFILEHANEPITTGDKFEAVEAVYNQKIDVDVNKQSSRLDESILSNNSLTDPSQGP